MPEIAFHTNAASVPRSEIEAKYYDLKVVNPHARSDEDTCTPEELLDVIEAKGREVAQALEALRVGWRAR